jgi:hypothetical protein
MKSSKRARHLLAGGVLALAALAAAMVWHAHRQLAGLHAAPITLGQATSDAVWVHLHDTLHAFDARGERFARIAEADLGLPAPVLHLHAVQRDDLLVAAGSPPRLKRCTPSARSCRDVDHGYIAAFRRFDNKVWIGANADASRVVVVDNAAHRVAVLDGEGVLIASAGSERFDYPSQAVWDGEDGFWLANSEKSRLERIGVDAATGTLTATQREVQLSGRDTILLGRTWPMALAAAADGGLWVVPKKTWIGPGGLVHLSAAGTFDRDRTLPVDADFTAITRMGNTLIGADFNGPRLHRIALDGGASAEPFGGEAFAAELRSHATLQAHWKRMQQWALGALIGLPLLGALLLAAMGERLPVAPAGYEPPAPALVPTPRAAPGVLRIPVTRAHRDLLRRLMWVALVTVVLPMVLLLAMLPSRSMLLAMLLVLPSLPFLYWAFQRQLTTELVVVGNELVLERHGREVVRAPLAQLWTDGRRVLIANEVVVLMLRAPVFEPEPVREYLLASVPALRWIGSVRFGLMQWRAFMRGQPLLFAALVGLLVVACVVLSLPKSTWVAIASQLAPWQK